jgi:hypothetical protein
MCLGENININININSSKSNNAVAAAAAAAAAKSKRSSLDWNTISSDHASVVKKKRRVSRRNLFFQGGGGGGVQFQDGPPQIHSIPSVGEWTKEEKLDCWFSRTALRAMKKRAVEESNKHNSINNSNNSNNLDADLYTPRGLERRSKAGSVAFRTVKRRAIRAVIAEQWRQKYLKEHGTANDQTSRQICLAQVYQRATRTCCQQAQERALYDAQQAQLVYQEEVSGVVEKNNNHNNSNSNCCATSTASTTATNTNTNTNTSTWSPAKDFPILFVAAAAAS